jgi:hypothetical protein
MKDLFRIGVFTGIVILCTVLPFLPGRHDVLAVPLSSMAQVIGTAGLILVPVGSLWMAAERVQRLAGLRFASRLLAFVMLAAVWAAVTLVATVQGGFALGIVSLACGVSVARKAWSSSRLPVYLVVVPLLVALVQLTLVDRAVAFSRQRAIRNSAPLIAAIERHRVTHGRYPESLLSVNPDIWPGVIGIAKYHYEPSGDAYNLVFEQFTYRFGTREFVMYNPHDKHGMTSHALDLLEVSPDQLALDRTRGHYAVRDAASRHWKYFWFD